VPPFIEPESGSEDEEPGFRAMIVLLELHVHLQKDVGAGVSISMGSSWLDKENSQVAKTVDVRRRTIEHNETRLK